MALTIKNIFPAILWIIIFEIISANIGILTNGGDSTWYDTLEKPLLNPPPIVFPIVWTALYMLIALAGYFSWQKRKTDDGRVAFRIFVIYTLLNWSWSFVFFGAQLLLPAFWLIVFINLHALIFIIQSWVHNRLAACLMIPPFLWTSFAMYLSFMIWMMNV